MKKVRVGLLAVGLLSVGLLSGCSSMRVVTDYSEAADFTQLRLTQLQQILACKQRAPAVDATGGPWNKPQQAVTGH